MSRKTPRILDPTAETPDSHPVGTVVGVSGGAVAGAAIGSTVGPLGTVAGAAIGAAAGAIAGKAAARVVNPDEQDRYWRDAHRRAPYYDSSRSYEDDYAPAYRLGYGERAAGEASFEDAEERLRDEWERTRGSSRLDWNDARLAALDAWDRANDLR